MHVWLRFSSRKSWNTPIIKFLPLPVVDHEVMEGVEASRSGGSIDSIAETQDLFTF